MIEQKIITGLKSTESIFFFFIFFLFGHLIPTFVLHVELRMKGICLLEKGLRPGCGELIIIITDYIRRRVFGT